MSKDLFISYAQEDKEFALRIKAEIEKRGVTCWIDVDDCVPGNPYPEDIAEGIKNARCILLVFSEHANESRAVKTEVENAFSLGKFIIPVRIREVEPSQGMLFLFGNCTWVDAWSEPMERHMDRLVDAVEKILGARMPVPPSPHPVPPTEPGTPSPSKTIVMKDEIIRFFMDPKLGLRLKHVTEDQTQIKSELDRMRKRMLDEQKLPGQAGIIAKNWLERSNQFERQFTDIIGALQQDFFASADVAIKAVVAAGTLTWSRDLDDTLWELARQQCHTDDPLTRRFLDEYKKARCRKDSAFLEGVGELVYVDGLFAAPRIDENVQFSVYRPKVIEPMSGRPILVFAHLDELPLDVDGPDPIEEVRRQAKRVLGDDFEDYRNSTHDSEGAIPRDGEITFLPEVQGIEFNPQRRIFRWKGKVHREEFEMWASPELDGQTAKGRVLVFLGALLIAEIGLSIQIRRLDIKDKAHPGTERNTARRYRRIFPSYSRKDVEVVKQFERYAGAVGDTYLRDCTTLRAGEVFDKQLMMMIEEADVFQLFWSWNAMTSSYVTKEWSYALRLKRPNFVRPTYWQEPFPESPERRIPPEELRRLHFHYLSSEISPHIPHVVETHPPEEFAPVPDKNIKWSYKPRKSTGAWALASRTENGERQWLTRWNRNWESFGPVGGHKEARESFRECLVRELGEELRLSDKYDFIVPPKPKGNLECEEYSVGSRRPTDYTMEVFDVAFTDSGMRALRTAPKNIRWVNESEIRDEKCADGMPISRAMGLLLDMVGWQ